jgi:glycosyltransferase involved in cell wall biosynthesis
MTHLSVVVPVLNEETLIQELIQRVIINCEKITSEYEIIIVDDGSTDDTWAKISNESRTNLKIKALKFSRNFGHHYALTAGLNKTSGDWVVVMDGDLQDRPEVIPDLYKKAKEGFDVVFVSRQNRTENLLYQLAQKIFYWLLKVLSGIDFDSSQANFSIISKKVVMEFRNFPEKARFYGSTIKWLGFNRSQIFALHGKRHSGTPSYTFRKRFKLASDIILSFSERPLKFAISLGIAVSSLSILSAIWIIYSAIIWGFSVTGWTSLIFSIFFFSGVLLIVLGIIGLYIGRIFEEVKKRPLYIVEKNLNF